MSCLSRHSSRVSLQWTWGSTKPGHAHYFPFQLGYKVPNPPLKLSDLRKELVEVVRNKENKLHGLLPALYTSRSNLRNTGKFWPVFKTSRFRNSFFLRPMPSRLNKLCFPIYSFTIFDWFLFCQILFFYFLTNHNFTVVYSCIVSMIRFLHFSL